MDTNREQNICDDLLCFEACILSHCPWFQTLYIVLPGWVIDFPIDLWISNQNLRISARIEDLFALGFVIQLHGYEQRARVLAETLVRV